MRNREHVPGETRAPLVVVAAALLLVVCAYIGLTIQLRTDHHSGNTEIGVSDNVLRTQGGCALEQTFRFTRCGHTVTRRILVPEALIGADFEQMRNAYDTWNIDSFSAQNVVMSRDVDLFCPIHLVLMTDETGYLGIFQNEYGDGMAFLEKLDCTAEDFPEELREEMYQGIGFDTREELDDWVLSHRKDKS